jgi:hypothetical protein
MPHPTDIVYAFGILPVCGTVVQLEIYVSVEELQF